MDLPGKHRIANRWANGSLILMILGIVFLVPSHQEVSGLVTMLIWGAAFISLLVLIAPLTMKSGAQFMESFWGFYLAFLAIANSYYAFALRLDSLASLCFLLAALGYSVGSYTYFKE